MDAQSSVALDTSLNLLPASNYHSVTPG